jgi:predicted nuclease of predicted toxin-antitoxin system
VKVLLDQGVPRRATEVLRDVGFDAVHTSEIGLASATDVAIIDWARDNGAIVATLDADFHAIIALSGETRPSAIRLRMQGQKGPEIGRLLVEIIQNRSADLAAGALVTVRAGRLRVRRLPVAGPSP